MNDVKKRRVVVGGGGGGIVRGTVRSEDLLGPGGRGEGGWL